MYFKLRSQCRCFCAELQAVVVFETPQWDSSGSGLISIIHASLSEISALIAAFRQLYDVEERAVGGGGEGNILGSVSGAGMTRFQWAGTPSYAKITSSLISRLVLACARKLSKCAEFIPPTAAEENTSPLIGDIFMVTVKFITRWPPLRPLCLPRSTVTSGRPNVVAAFVDKHTVAYYGMVHKPGSVIDSLVQHIRSVSVSRKGPCQFHSKQHPV